MIQVFINEEEVVSDKEFTITEEMLATSSTILNNLYPKSWETNKDYVTNFYFPEDYSKCKILKDGELVFCGVIKNTGEISLNPRYPHYCSLQILDFKTFLSEGETLDFVIANKTIREAIEMIVEAISDYGFILGNINIHNEDEIIGAYSAQEKTAYDVFQYIADISQSKWFTRTIDESTVAIDFYDPTLMPRADNIQYTNEYFKNNKIIDMTWQYGTRDYRNKQVMLSNEVYGNIDYTDNIIASGYTRTFNTIGKIGAIKSIKVGNIDKTFATNTDKELGADADFYYTPGENTFESNSNQNIYGAGTQISVVYTPIVQGRQIVYDNDEVSRIRTNTGRKGTIARYENRNDVVSSEELNKVGQAYIRYKGSAEIQLNISTEDKDLFNIGQIVHFEAPLQDLATDYMVKKKEIRAIITADKIFYTYQLVSNFNSENAINWFDNQRNKASGNIAQGEYIARNIDIENTANIIFSNLTVEEVTVQGDNILDCVLDSPFNN